MFERLGRLVVAATAVLALAGAPAAELGAQEEGADPLAGLELEKGRLAWDGIALGTSLVRAERLLGVTLAVDRGVGESPCAKWVATADRNGLRLTMGFAAPKPGAKIEWLRVRFEGNQILASGPELAETLARHLPAATWRQPEGTPTLEDDLRPVFVLPGEKQPQLVQLAPREWMVLADEGCLG